MKCVIHNIQQLETCKKDMEQLLQNKKSINLSYEESHKARTKKQEGFIFAALINQITDFLQDCGFNVDADDIRYKLYRDVSEILPEMIIDKQIFGGQPRIKHLGDMDRVLCSKFIDGVFTVIDQDPLYSGLQLHPSTYYNFIYHLDPEEIKFAQTQILPERDEDYLRHIRTMPCLICGIQHRSEAHHIRDVRTSGTAIKSPDFFAVPLCHTCHMTVAHGTGFRDSLRWIPLDLLDFCKINYIRWKNKK